VKAEPGDRRGTRCLGTGTKSWLAAVPGFAVHRLIVKTRRTQRSIDDRLIVRTGASNPAPTISTSNTATNSPSGTPFLDPSIIVEHDSAQYCQIEKQCYQIASTTVNREQGRSTRDQPARPWKADRGAWVSVAAWAPCSIGVLQRSNNDP